MSANRIGVGVLGILLVIAGVGTRAAAADPKVSPPPESFYQMVSERDRDVARRIYAKYIDVNGMLVGSHEDRSDHDKDKHKNHHRGEDSDDGD